MSKRPGILLIVCTLILAAGCGGPAASRKQDPAPGKATASTAPAPAKAPQTAKPSVPEGSISRTVLLSHHKVGPQRFIAKIRVKATFRRGKFFGWRVLSYHGPGPINPGDVVINVLAMPIERPDQFMKVWDKLPSIEVLTVKLLREDKIQTLTFPVVDDTRAMP